MFEKKTRLNFKTSKCKLMPMNGGRKGVKEMYLDGEKLEVVDDHVYLGTIISSNGQRVKEMNDRMKKSKSVANEIVQVCKETELFPICLRYVKLLLCLCLDSKLKYGSALWDVCGNKKAARELNGLKPNVLKRVLQLPSSTPSDALMYDFGINDLSLDIMMEKIVLAVETMKRENERISRQLLTFLMENKVDGFCSELEEVCQVLGVSFEELLHVNDARKVLKEKIVKIQGQLLYKRMMVSSKMDF